MGALVSRWDRAGDYRAVFVRSYRIITRRMGKAVLTGVFEDGVWMEALDVRFAREYFDAVDAYDSGAGHLPSCWRLAFDLARQKRTTVLQDLLLGINAHILRDLPVALDGMGLEPSRRALRKRDHDRVNQVLEGLIEEVQAEIERHYSWALGLFDKLLGQTDEFLTDAALRTARADAWTMAIALSDAPGETARGDVLQSLDASASSAGRLLAAPGSLLKGLIRPLARGERALRRLFPRPADGA